MKALGGAFVAPSHIRIGLALVQELVALHGGSVRVQSVYGEGSTFIISIPLGFSHLPSDRIQAERTNQSTALGANALGRERGNLPAITLTAHAQPQDRLRALAAGFDAHVAKPVELVELITVIASVTRRKNRV